MTIGNTNGTESEKKSVAKVVLLGDAAAGKTSFLYRFVKDEFCELMPPTVGGSFFSYSIYLEEAKEDVQFQIWDTAGQEIYRSLAPLYYRNADAAILLYDITDVKSFEGAKRWVEDLEEEARSSRPFIILVGNKSDLDGGRSVPRLQAEAFAFQNCLPAFTEASAKTGHNVHQIFYTIARELHEIQSKHFDGVVLTIDDNPKPSRSCCPY